MHWGLLGTLTTALALAVSASGAATSAAEPLRVISTGTRSGITAARQVVVKTPGEWQKLLTQKAAPELKPDDPNAKVDFTKEMVLGVFLGQRATGGYGVVIKDVKEQKGKLLVTYQEVMPGAGNITIQVITYPYQLVAVKKSSLPVVWKREVSTRPSGRRGLRVPN
jgi:hypothetical protein